MTDPGPPSNVDPADAPPPPGATAADFRLPKDTETTLAVVSLVLGIVGLMGCQLMGPIALVLGWMYRRSAQARGVEPDPMGIIGLVLGAISTLFLIMGLVIGGGLCVVYFGIFVISLLVAAGTAATSN